jgi:peptidoglycan/LPS O-acetylase OafA/YrhL
VIATPSPSAADGAPPRVLRRMPHLPALDGLRGLAVIGVLLFHGGFSWAKGGFLGVSVFFTLSGFLITNLLVREHDGTGTISLREFWSRRFRRLMPAAIAGLFLVCLYGVFVATPEQLQNLRGDLLASLAYVANWRFVASGTSYGDLFTAPSPVQHFWSLAIEEQFYVVYPLLALVALRLGGRRAFGGVLAVLGVASIAASFALANSVDRTYYGTDTRAFELVAGALLALWWSNPGREDRRAAHTRTSWPIEALGAVALVGTIAAWAVVTQSTERLARGGFALQAVATGAVILAAAAPGPLRTVLSIRPLRFVGLVSYGLYLYHWPVFLWLDEARVGWDRTPLFLLRMAVTAVLTAISYYAIEQPIRLRRALHGRQVQVALPVSVAALVAVTVAVTWNPPPSTIAYADVSITDLRETVTTNTAPAPPVSAGAIEPPSTVFVLGDSGMHDGEPAITAALQAAGARTVVDLSGPGFGFTLPEINWRERWRDAAARHQPKLSIVMLGGWDYEFGTKEPDAYLKILDEAIGILTASGGKVLWLSMLPGGITPERSIDATFARLPARHPGVVAYTDIEAALRAPDGSYPRSIRDEAGREVLIRKPDKWHLCPEGAERLTAAVMAALEAQRWAPAPKAGWEDGTWRSHPRYNDPPGGCRSAT